MDTDVTAYSTERTVVDANDAKLFLNELKKYDIPASLMFDIEHLVSTSTLKPLYEKIKPYYFQAYLGLKSKNEVDILAEEILLEYIRKKPKKVKNEAYEYIENYFQELQSHIVGIHISGVDPKHYEKSGVGISRLGAHLPICYNDGIIKDIFDYEQIIHWAKKLKIPLIIEALPKGKMTYIDTLKFSKSNLEGLIDKYS